MDAFESLVGELLRSRGYWVVGGFKVELTKAEKRRIGRPSSPRWELDLIAYNAKRNELLVVECKSYLDSRGVVAASFKQEDTSSRYKLFVDPVLRKVVFHRLVRQLTVSGMVRPQPVVRLALAAARIASTRDRRELGVHFANEGWDLYDATWLKEQLRRLSHHGYQDSVVAVLSKILLRDMPP